MGEVQARATETITVKLKARGRGELVLAARQLWLDRFLQPGIDEPKILIKTDCYAPVGDLCLPILRHLKN